MRVSSALVLLLGMLAVASATSTLRHLRIRSAQSQSLHMGVGTATQTTATATPAPATTTSDKKTWAQLSTPVDEPKKQVGMEFELNWITGGYKDDGIPLKWAEANGHKALYTGAKDWKNWEIHLDGRGAVWPEFVMLPVSKTTLKKELQRFKDELGSIIRSRPSRSSPNKSWQEFLDKHVEAGNFVKGPHPENVFTGFRDLEVSTGASSRPAGAPQVTSTYTIDEMKVTGGMANVVYQAIGSPANDKAMRDNMYKTPFKNDAKLHESVLIKNMAEQLGTKDSTAVTITSPPKPAKFPDAGIDKVKEEYELHTVANKVGPLFTRGGKPAYLIEIRKKAGYAAWLEDVVRLMKGQAGTTFTDLQALVDAAFK